MAAPIVVPPGGAVIKLPGSYVLSSSVSFTGVGAPPECLDPLSGVAVCGILIEADGVSLDLAGFTVGLSVSAALRLREFSCIRITGGGALVSGGSVGRASAFGVLATGRGHPVLKALTVRHFEVGGISVAGATTGATVSSCSIGPNFQGRRPGADLSLAARYLPTLSGLPAGVQLAAALAAAATKGPFRSDLGACVGLAVGDCLGSVAVETVSVEGVVQRPAQAPFLAFPGSPLPQGALGDPIPAGGAGSERAAAQEAAAQAGLLPPPDQVPVCQEALPHPCASYATNLGTCSSCTVSRKPVVAQPVLVLGLDAFGSQVIGALGVQLENLTDYAISDVGVLGLAASLEKGRASPCPAAPVSGARARASTGELLLQGCRGGTADNVPEPLLVHSERPAGAPCTLPCGFSAAWMASGSSQLSARPVGNPQNVQLVPTFLPTAFLCPPP